jgi:hypothetical protein
LFLLKYRERRFVGKGIWIGVLMKHSTKASLLSLILPGAGLWYCGLRKLAVFNLLLAVAVPAFGFSLGFLSEHVLWIFLAIAAGSAGYAHSMSFSDTVARENARK